MKRLFVLFVAVLISIRAFAGVGIVGGVTAPRGNIDMKALEMFHAGLAVNIELPAGFALQPEILYSVKGATVEELRTNVKMGYIEVPLQIQWGLNLAKRNFRVYAFGEPFVGYNLSTNPINPQTSIGEVVDKLEYGLGLGLGLQLFKHIQISGAYVWNLDGQRLNTFKTTNPHGARLSLAILF